MPTGLKYVQDCGDLGPV